MPCLVRCLSAFKVRAGQSSAARRICFVIMDLATVTFTLERIFRNSQKCSSCASRKDELFRKLKSEEHRLVVKLAGDEFPYRHALLDQLDDAKITKVYGFFIYEFRVNSKFSIPISSSLLGEG